MVARDGWISVEPAMQPARLQAVSGGAVMTAHFPVASPSRAPARERPARRSRNGAVLIALCWSVAALGLLGSYGLGALALQAGACLLGLIGAAVAMLLLMTQGD
jgi:hypothetical protein